MKPTPRQQTYARLDFIHEMLDEQSTLIARHFPKHKGRFKELNETFANLLDDIDTWLNVQKGES